MGKKAKLKQTRKEQPQTLDKSTNTTDFVADLNKLGYQLKQIKRSPSIPQEKIEPQL